MKKWFLSGLLVLVVLFAVWQRRLIYYGYVQAKGQLTIVWGAKPLEDFLNDEQFPDSLKVKIRFVQKVKAFAFEELGINETKNYSDMYDQQGQPLMWVVTACKPFALEAKTWDFPIIGSFPYKGFFDPNMAQQELERIKSQGYDVGVRNPGGWSTLGWFNDPILSEMLNRNYGQLAELIIHELTHSTIFVKDSVEFNENLASFIGHKGAIQYLKTKYGHKPEYLEDYLREEEGYKSFVNHFMRGATLLDSIYGSIKKETEQKKLEVKKEAITTIIVNLDTLHVKDSLRWNQMFMELPNNTYFMSFLRYRSKQDDFEKIFKHDFDRDVRKLIAYYKEKFPFL